MVQKTKKQTKISEKKTEKVIKQKQKETTKGKEEVVKQKETTKKQDEVVPKKYTKKIVTVDTIVEELNNVLELINTELDRLKMSTDKNKNTRLLKSIRKKLTYTQKKVPKVTKRKNKRSVNGVSGFAIKYPITDEFSDFLELPKNTLLSREEAQCALSVYVNLKENEDRVKILKWAKLNQKHRDLRNPQSTKQIIPDEKLSKLLNYDKYKDDVKKGLITMNDKKLGVRKVVTDDTLEFYVIMKLIQPHFLKKTN